MDDLANRIQWHKPAHRAVMASVKLGAWMSAALDDPKVCDAMKADIEEWFSAGEPMETLGQALEALTAERDRLAAELAGVRDSQAKDDRYHLNDLARYKDKP